MSQQGTSPPTVVMRISDLRRELDWLGFDFEKFLHRRASGGSTESPMFPNPSSTQIEELENYADLHGWKFRLKSSYGSSFLSCPVHPHHRATVSLNFPIAQYNNIRTGQDNRPFSYEGGRPILVNGNRYDPDSQFEARNRVQPSPNLVLENNYMSDQPVKLYHRRLRAFITGTPGVMIVLGVKLFEVNEDGDFSAICVTYERDHNDQAKIAHNISFGTMPVSPADLSQWNEATGNHPLVGVGVDGCPPCDAAHQDDPVYILPLRQDYLLARNSSPPFLFNPGEEPDGEFVLVKLFFVQRAVRH